MKRLLATMLMMTMLLIGMISAHAEDLGVRVIGGDMSEKDAVNLDDIQIGQTYVIDGYAQVSVAGFSFVDQFMQFGKGKAGSDTTSEQFDWDGTVTDNVRYSSSDSIWHYYYDDIFYMRSGEAADFAWLSLDVTNMQKQPIKFSEEAEITVVYDDEYEFAGWLRQYNYDYDLVRGYSGDNESIQDTEGTEVRAALDPMDEEEIDMMYTGHFIFGCTLPNAAINGAEPLKMIIKLGGNELTYHIRK